MMPEQQADAFAEAVLDRVAKLAYGELRPHLDAYLARRPCKTSTLATWAMPSTSGATVLPLDRARARRAG
ncbi:hypothetical protein DQE82_29615 [Micromonospora sp. LHW51205]|uniref:hypothetical protein n=1 Tax=Micromonospora sp. LHW51205 TaxID=2248752 RepID=UPI000DE9B9F4|nr:hypothetical protein [Micromonospora sp. LHW51205]RBQ03895.1 hypothetical protein DQE82_29615 [Micromonospora sp. LHW51205]